jgi:hypothetical protein
MEQEESVLLGAFLKEEPTKLDLSAFLVEEKAEKKSNSVVSPSLSSSGDQLRRFTDLCNRLDLNSNAAVHKRIESSPNFPPQKNASPEFSAIKQKIKHKNYAYQSKRQ